VVVVLLTTPQRELQSEQLIMAAQADADAQCQTGKKTSCPPRN